MGVFNPLCEGRSLDTEDFFTIFTGKFGIRRNKWILSQFTVHILSAGQEIKRFWTCREQLGFRPFITNLAGNVLIFVPFGFFLPMASKFRSVATTVFFSASSRTADVISDVNLRVNHALAENGIEVPYPYVNVISRK